MSDFQSKYTNSALKKFWYQNLYGWRYFITISAVYLGWKVYKEIYYRSELLTQAGKTLNDILAYSYIKILAFTARIFNEMYTLGKVARNGHTYYSITLADSQGIYLGWHCLAIPAHVVFTGTILLFRGSFSKKVSYLVIGNVIIYFTNFFRLAGLLFMNKYATRYFFEFNHSYTYLFLTYLVIFLLILFYIRKLEPTLNLTPN